MTTQALLLKEWYRKNDPVGFRNRYSNDGGKASTKMETKRKTDWEDADYGIKVGDDLATKKWEHVLRVGA